MEQLVRHRANLFPKFNGTGGLWRRSCLEAAGGWNDDTVCEDLCLSTRALLNGWQFRFLNDVIAPAEIPASISAYKNQQARWAKGSFQCLLKFAGPISRAKEHSFMARLYALLAMSAYLTHVLVLLILLLQIPLILLDYQVSSWIFVFTIAGLGQPLLFILGQQVLYDVWLRRLRHFPTMLLLAIGMAPTSTRAILQALYGRSHPFIRTPKQGSHKHRPLYKLPFDSIVLVELLLAAYSLLAIVLAIHFDNHGPLFFLLTCLLGLGTMASLTIHEYIKTQAAQRKTTPIQNPIN
jgi:cellulose synthase/poly-beta-1,6-N-acetylglucosamine synthase-like glycosyltransferase